ncbi:MAG: adenylyl-sulfate kinase, partial [Pyrinomonadaceae bacterium]
VCYGRDVGYGIRRVELDNSLHVISGTKKRISAKISRPIIWLTGQSGSGKTTLAGAIKALMDDAVILDGDDMRESISDEGFTAEDRHKHNLRVARLAQVLSKQSPVIVAVIAPFSETRREIDRLISPRWVLCRRRAQKEGSEFPYEVPDPTETDIIADNDAASPAENAAAVVEMLRSGTGFDFVDADAIAQAASAVDETAG